MGITHFEGFDLMIYIKRRRMMCGRIRYLNINGTDKWKRIHLAENTTEFKVLISN